MTPSHLRPLWAGSFSEFSHFDDSDSPVEFEGYCRVPLCRSVFGQLAFLCWNLDVSLSHGFGEEDRRREVTFSTGPIRSTHCHLGHRGAGLDLLAEACQSGSPTAPSPSPRVHSVL